MSTMIPENKTNFVELRKNAEYVTSFRAPMNIAVVKYWGKRDEEKILPINSSISATLHADSLCSTTVLMASKRFEQNEFWLNETKCDFDSNKRLVGLLNNCLRLCGDLEKWKQYKFIIWSRNNFPTAAGLASSASGFACLTSCLASMLNIKESYPGEITTIARQGSGSACRSMFGGWVQWEKGELEDGSDSIALQIFSESWWDKICVLILITNQNTKKVKSSDGMKMSIKTSSFIEKTRKGAEIADTIKLMRKAIETKKFEVFATLMMKESNRLHAICMDTFPPIFYLSETSFEVISLVHSLNKTKTIVGYTFDAGPNAFLFTLRENLQLVLETIECRFGTTELTDDLGILDYIQNAKMNNDSSLIKRIILTKLGPGPENCGN